MSAPDPAQVSAEALRIHRLLESVLDRHAGQSEGARAEALLKTLQTELMAQPKERRGLVLRELEALNPADESPAEQASSDGEGRRELEAEVARLRAEVAALAAAPHPTALPPGGLTRALVEILTGSSREAEDLLARDPAIEQRLLEQLKILTDFVAVIGRSFLSATAEPDATMSGRIQGVLTAELAGRAPGGSFSALLRQIQHQIGGQLYAFREACDAGAQNLLRQLAPAAIAAEASRAAVSVAGWRPFSTREQWERFEQKYEALRRADNLFETYFDGAFRKAVLRLTRQVEEEGGGTS